MFQLGLQICAESCRISQIFSSYDDDDADDHDDEDDDDDNMLLPVMSVSRCLLVTKKADCYVTNRLIYEDLEVPYFVDHRRALTESSGSNLFQGISPATCKALIPTKSCLRATVVQLTSRICPSVYGFTFDTVISVQHCSSTLTDFFNNFPQL